MDDLAYYLDGMSSRNRTVVRRQSAIEFCRRIRESDQAKFFQNISPQLDEVGTVLANLNAGDASLTRLAIISALNLSAPVSGVSYLPSSLVSFLLTNLDNARDSPSSNICANTLSTPVHVPSIEPPVSQSYSSRRRRQVLFCISFSGSIFFFFNDLIFKSRPPPRQIPASIQVHPISTPSSHSPNSHQI
jgi:hypothetical protein